MSEKPISGARVAREMLSRSPAWFTMHRAELERAGFPKALPVLNAYYPPAVRRAIADMDIHVDFASPDCYEIDTKVPRGFPRTARKSQSPFGDWEGVPGVYLASFHAFIKIGVSGDIGPRLRQIQGNLPGPLVMLGAIIGGDETDEKDLHRRFAAHRTKGEWFAAVPELLAYIEEAKKQTP